MEFYSADIEMLMSGWKTLYNHQIKRRMREHSGKRQRHRRVEPGGSDPQSLAKKDVTTSVIIVLANRVWAPTHEMFICYCHVQKHIFLLSLHPYAVA
jgi:hypothetical protein